MASSFSRIMPPGNGGVIWEKTMGITYMLWVWLIIVPCDTSKGEQCSTVIHDSAKEFFSLAECQAAKEKQAVEFRAARLLRWTATCHKRSGPFLEPEPQANRAAQ